MDNPPASVIFSLMTFDTDIVIVGGGLNGPALALALAEVGHHVTIIDALPLETLEADDFDGRSYAMALTSTRLLDGIGVWGSLVENAQPILDIKVTDGRAGEGASPFFMHFDHAEIEEGPMGYMVEDRHLRAALLDALRRKSHVTQLNGERVVAQDPDATGVTVTLASGKNLRARLLVGCDGRGSGTAQRAGITRTGWDYDQTALVCAIAHEKPHHGVAHQFFMPSGPLAILPLTGNRSSIVWTESTAHAAEINALPDQEYLEVLRPRFGSFLGEITLAGKRFTYPLSLSLANSLIAERVVLVGDAAHGVHPIAGQGLNAGVRDVAALAEVISDAARRGEDIGAGAVLARYQQWRRFDNTTLALATDTFNRLFSNDNAALRALRDLGMGIVASLPGLRRGFIREAAGLTGDLPKLLKGQRL
jgi:2-octaprenyl-6-methoxyphenol hydroxylase